VTDPKHPDVTPRLPENDVRVDFGKPAPGSSNPMPADVVLAYEERIQNSAEAQVAGAEKALKLFIG
jgi:hypothetical protein